jgi:hypothetical protein
MSSDVQPIVTFHAVRDAATVRAVVEAIGALGRPGLRALGSATGHGDVVAIEADNVADSIRGRGVVRLLDPRAQRLDHAAPESGQRGSALLQVDRAAG